MKSFLTAGLVAAALTLVGAQETVKVERTIPSGELAVSDSGLGAV
jgi:hypothetical protein